MRKNLQLKILILLITLVHNQKKLTLHVPQTQSISLNPENPKKYAFKLQDNTPSNQDLYIHVQPSVLDPFQVPFLTLTADSNYTQNCYNAHEQFAGVCKIDSKELTVGRQFSLSIKCITDCTLDLSTYFGDILKLQLGELLVLNSYESSGLSVGILVEIPDTAIYTSIQVVATIANIQKHTESTDDKIDMLVNYGDKDIPIPTDINFTVQGVSLFTGGRGVYLSREDAPPGSWIKVYLRLEQGTSIIFNTRKINSDVAQILLGSSYFEYIDDQQLSKTYYLNLTSRRQELPYETVQLVFDVYSGNPQLHISFDSLFQQEIPFNRKTSATSYSLSPALRKSNNFSDLIYIKIESTIASQYYFYSKIDQLGATYMEPYLCYLDQLQYGQLQNYFLIQKFKYQLGNSTVRNYAFKIDISKGYGIFYIKRCAQIQNSQLTNTHAADLNTCMLSSKDLKGEDFMKQLIAVDSIVNGNKMSIQMSYDISNCSQGARKDQIIYKQCAFQIVAVGQSQQPFMFQISSERKFYTTYLRENSVVKDYVYKDNYIYYAFSLPSTGNVTRIQIFSTTFSGEAALLASTTQPFPTFKTELDQIRTQTGEKSSIVFQQQPMPKDIYISIYAYQFTEVNLGVVVHRTTDNPASNQNAITLSKGDLLTYSLDPQHSIVLFRLNSQNSQSVVATLNELVGHAALRILNQNNTVLDCIGNIDDPLVCQVETTPNTTYIIQVQGEQGKTNKFTITYKTKIGDCTSAALNLPISVVMHPSEMKCYTFAINRKIDLKFVSSLSYSQQLNRQVYTDFYVNQLIVDTIKTNQYFISIQDLLKNCQMGASSPSTSKTCFLSVDFMGDSNQTSSFSFVVEEDDADVALFDGIVEKVFDRSGRGAGGRLFYYHLYSPLPVRVFFTTQSLQITYILVAKIISKQTLLNRNRAGVVNLLQDYVDKLQSINNSTNLFSTILNSQGTSIVSINQQFIKEYCATGQDCYLLLLITSIDPEINGSFEQISYEIQVTQEETSLSLGDTKIGFIQKDQVYMYLLTPADAYINLRNMNSDGRRKEQCATLFTDNGTIQQYTEVGNTLYLTKNNQIDRVYVRGDALNCSYQISYTALYQSVTNARLSTLYELDLQAEEVERFLFYNNHPKSFRIMQMVSAGSADIYIQPFDQENMTLDSVRRQDYKSFPLVDSIDGDLVVSFMNSYFCSDCFYYVVVTTKTRFIGEIVFVRLNEPVPITVGHILKQTIKPTTEIQNQQYIFYSLTSFNITFNVLYGSMEVMIVGPEGRYLTFENINQTKTLAVKAVEFQATESSEFYSTKALYRIVVSSLVESEFYIKIDHYRATQRIFEGYPVTIDFASNSSTVVEFVNSQHLDSPVTLMVTIDDLQNDSLASSFSQPIIDLFAQLDTGQTLKSPQLTTKLVTAEQTLVYNLKNVLGTYFINISTDRPVNMTFVLFKMELTHLTATKDHVFDKQGIFQLAGNNRSVLLQIFTCKGDIAVIASKNYKQIADPMIKNSQFITLKRPNYGGHYVFGVQDVLGSYFLKIISKNNQNELQYLISYHYYEDVNPYNFIDAPNYDVAYQLDSSGLRLNVSAPVAESVKQFKNRSSLNIKNVSYLAYASTVRQNLDRYSRCSINNNVQTFYSEGPSIFIHNSQLSSYHSQNQTPSTIFINVQASILIQITAGCSADSYPKVLTVLYNTIEVDITKPSTLANLGVFIGWMMLPFVVAAMIVVYLLKFCLRKLMMRQKDMVEEAQQKAPTTESLPDDQGVRTDLAMAPQDYENIIRAKQQQTL